MNILITGGAGFVGSALSERLRREGHRIWVLRRPFSKNLSSDNAGSGNAGLSNPVSNNPVSNNSVSSNSESRGQIIFGDLLGGLDEEAITSIPWGGVIHLAGENLASRVWSREQKKRIFDSRVLGTQRLIDLVYKKNKNKSSPPEFFISASAVGYYGDRGDEILSEDSLPGTGFLSDVCQAWEKSSSEIDAIHSSRRCVFRFGLVLSRKGGVLPKMLAPYRFGIAPLFGSGNQWMSWISLEDLIEGLILATQNPQMKGIYNAVAPHPIRARDWIGAWEKKYDLFLKPKVPESWIRSALFAWPEMSDLFLASQKVVPSRMMQLSFPYRHPDLIQYIESQP